MANAQLGGVYLYANQQGCDGDRLYYDGACMIAMNGQILARGTQFSLNDVEVVTATVDLEAVRAHRKSSSRSHQAAQSPPYERLRIDMRLDGGLGIRVGEDETSEKGMTYHTPEEEIALGPACWLWDYLRRSRTQGYFLPLSGGIDSCATAAIVHSMCRLVAKAASEGSELAETRISSQTRQTGYRRRAPHDWRARRLVLPPDRPQGICKPHLPHLLHGH